MSREVLCGAIGILTISAKGETPRPMQIFHLKKSSWLPDHTMGLEETLPVSHFGLQSGLGLEYAAYRLPIMRKTREYLKIIVEPVSGTSVWVSTKSLTPDFQLNETYFNALVGFPDLIDYAFEENDGFFQLYKSPDRSSNSATLTPAYLQSFKVIAQKDDFIQLGEDLDDPEGGPPKVRPAGWIPIRDKDGCLSIWITAEDDC